MRCYWSKFRARDGDRNHHHHHYYYYDHDDAGLKSSPIFYLGKILSPASHIKATVQFITKICSDEGLTLETSAFRISVRWPIYIINSVDKTKFLYTTSPPTQHHSFFRNYPFIHYQNRFGV